MYKILFLLFVFSSCGIAKEPEGKSSSISSKPAIYFVVMRIYRDDDKNENKIELIKKTLTEGIMKGKDESARQSTNNLLIYLIDNAKIKDSLIIDHPLYKHFEYADESGNFAVKDTLVASAEFFFRFQSMHSNSEIRIVERIGTKKTNELKQFKL